MMQKNSFQLIFIAMTSALLGCASTMQQENTLSNATPNPLPSSASVSLPNEPTNGFISHTLDPEDNAKAYQALDQGLRNQPTKWTNQTTGITYTIVSDSDKITVRNNATCKNYRATLQSKEGTKKVYGTACRSTEGSWEDVAAR